MIRLAIEELPYCQWQVSGKLLLYHVLPIHVIDLHYTLVILLPLATCASHY